MEIKEFLDALFEFEIGQLVYAKTAAGGVAGRDHPVMYQITERRLVQCPGGIQKSYVVGGHLHQEIELTRDIPIGRKLTDEEAESIRDYREKTRTTNWSNLAWLPEKPSMEVKDK